MKRLLVLALAAASLSVVTAPAPALADDCDDPEGPMCPTSPNFDPWLYEQYHRGPTDGADPVTGPICQNQVDPEEGGGQSPDPRDNGCILPW